MSEQNPTATLEAIASIVPGPATLAELRDACPGATNDFLVEQLDKKATAIEAMKAHMAAQAAVNAALVAERDTLKAQSAPPTPAAKPVRGTAPVGGVDDSDSTQGEFAGGANAFCRAEINQRIAAGMTRERAAAAVAKAHPTLRAAMIAEANGSRD